MYAKRIVFRARLHIAIHARDVAQATGVEPQGAQMRHPMSTTARALLAVGCGQMRIAKLSRIEEGLAV